MCMQQQQHPQKNTVYEFETLKKELANSTLAAAGGNIANNQSEYNVQHHNAVNNHIDIDWNDIDFQMYQDIDNNSNGTYNNCNVYNTMSPQLAQTNITNKQSASLINDNKSTIVGATNQQQYNGNIDANAIQNPQQAQTFTFVNEQSSHQNPMMINPSNVIMTNEMANNVESQNKPVFFIDSNVLWELADSDLSQNVGGFLRSPTV